MNLLTELAEIYSEEGFTILSGIDYYLSNERMTEYTSIYKDGKSLTHHLGISPKELYFFEALSGAFHPKSIFIIGNSFGWSSLALAKLNRNAEVVAIELGDESFTAEWIDRTNRMADRLGLNLKVVQGRSPEDSGETIAKQLGGKIDLMFVDGLHTSEQVVLDFNGTREFCHDQTLHIFHDAIAFGMLPGIDTICAQNGLQAHLLRSTPSGIAVLHKGSPPEAVLRVLHCFGASPEAEAVLVRAQRSGLRHEAAKLLMRVANRLECQAG